MVICCDAIEYCLLIFMSFLYFGNTPASVPPVFDTSPCMKEMLNYEDCVHEYNPYYSVLTSPTDKSYIQHGQPCGPECSPTEKQPSSIQTQMCFTIDINLEISSICSP